MLDEYFEEIRKLTKELIKNNLSKEAVEFKTENLPENRGVYLVYKKKENGIEENPSYIGCAYKYDRNIKVRCSQNLNPRDTGGTFRDRVMRTEMELEQYKEIVVENKRKKVINEENTTKGVKYISNNFILKFIEVDENTSENEVLLMERACIECYNPIYNKG